MYFAILLFCFGVLFALGKTHNQNAYVEFSEDEYPEDLDTLEEFIQSYYLILDSENYLKDYNFIDAEKNVLHNDVQGLNSFYQKLLEMRNGVRDHVVIYQIGDSHVQGGYFSGTARSALQKYFGNAGRGLIFPNRLAKTNQPDDYKINASTAGGFQRLDKPRSLSGFTLNISSANELNITTNNFFQRDCRFDHIRLFTNPEYEFNARDFPSSSQCKSEVVSNIAISSISYPEVTNQAKITLNSKMKQLFGISLERQEPGLLYHAMGVNGAGFYNLKDQDLLFEQSAILNSDLIIISLGTNDAQGRYRQETFERNLEEFMQKLKASNPTAAVLFTLPPDSNKQGKTNHDVTHVGATIGAYAALNGHAFWDLKEVMGGDGSISRWRSKSMAAKDFLHFTPKGYMLQGHLLYQAIIKGYKTFSENPEGR